MNKWKNITIELPGKNLKPVIEYFSTIDNIYSVSIKDKLSVQKSDWFDIPNEEISLKGDTHKIVFLVKDDYKTNKLNEKGKLVPVGFEYHSGNNNNFLSIPQIKKLVSISSN